MGDVSRRDPDRDLARARVTGLLLSEAHHLEDMFRPAGWSKRMRGMWCSADPTRVWNTTDAQTQDKV